MTKNRLEQLIEGLENILSECKKTLELGEVFWTFNECTDSAICDIDALVDDLRYYDGQFDD